jgi:hypothetical protein
MDYGMTSDTREVRVRKAMLKYYRHNLGLSAEAGSNESWAPYFQVVSEKKES